MDHKESIRSTAEAVRNKQGKLPHATIDDTYLQQFCRDSGVSSEEYADVWTDYTLQPWYEGGKVRDVVFEPFEGEMQADCLRRRGFLLVRIEVNETDCTGIENPDVLITGKVHLGELSYWVTKIAERMGSHA